MDRVAVFIALCCACSSTTSPVGPVRFVNAAPVWRVNDRLDVPAQPAENPFYRSTYHFTSYLLLARRGFNLTRHLRAQGVNSLDEVPDSTFFRNRVGVRPVSIAEIKRGAPGESPIANRPWTIKSAKIGGSVPGFICEDTAGHKFLLKFGVPGEPELDGAADVITGRLLYAAGWNVPSDHIVYFQPSDLVLAPDATAKVKGEKVKLEQTTVDAALAKLPHDNDGTLRGTASLYIGGKPLGGMPRLGVRADDPNDEVPHELRRDQRGMAPLAAWLAHTDMKEDNTLDSWEEDPADKSIHYIVHYHIDFGNSLGAFPRSNVRPQPDFEHEVDPVEFTKSFFSLGLYRRSWEGRVDPKIPGLGMYSDEDYQPDQWKPNPIGQFPVLLADRFDQFWGAKILIKFTRDQLAAAIEMGQLTDPRANGYLLDTMIKRQRRTAWFWFRRVNPIDELAVDDDRLCFTDLALSNHLETAATHYTIDAYDYEGRAVSGSHADIAPDERGRACTMTLPRGGTATDGRYTIVYVQTSRDIPGTLVHIADDPETSQPRVIGIHRL